MSFFFSHVLNSADLQDLIGVPVWKYGLTYEDYLKLRETLAQTDHRNIDPRDAYIYYAEWWKNEYEGGFPSKKAVFDSIGGILKRDIDEMEFHQLARKGAQLLGVKWIVHGRTEYFRTLLMQGGLPLKHISQNYNSYLRFLSGALHFQPDSVEELSDNYDLVKILPQSSQNAIVYEFSFEIVKAILEGSKDYDSLFESNDDVRRISTRLRQERAKLRPRVRNNKPKISWVLNLEDKPLVFLEIKFKEHYTKDELEALLGLELEAKNIPFFLDDALAGHFQKLLSGKYRYRPEPSARYIWNDTCETPKAAIIQNDAEHDVSYLVPALPIFDKPTLWAPRDSDGLQWRYIRSNSTAQEQAMILVPSYDEPADKGLLEMGPHIWKQIHFEGQQQVNHEGESFVFTANSASYDWTWSGHRPNWVIRSSAPAFTSKPTLYLYNDQGERITRDYLVEWYNPRSLSWNNYQNVPRLGPGFQKIRISVDDIVFIDEFYVFSDFEPSEISGNLNQAGVHFPSDSGFTITVLNSDLYNINKVKHNSFELDRGQSKKGVPGSIGLRVNYQQQKGLKVKIDPPFMGLLLIDEHGQPVEMNRTLAFNELAGYRILLEPRSKAKLRMRSRVRQEIVLDKTLTRTVQPLVYYKEEITQLLSLGLKLDHNNLVDFELKSANQRFTFKVGRYSALISYSLSDDSVQIRLSEPLNADLLVIPSLISPGLIWQNELKDENGYFSLDINSQVNVFVVHAESEEGKQVLPRRIGISEDFDVSEVYEELHETYRRLKSESFDEPAWITWNNYFLVCFNSDIPLSSFIYLMSLAVDPEIAAKAFFLLALDEKVIFDRDNLIHEVIPDLENDLGFCFHWISKQAWEKALNSSLNYAVSKYKGILTEDEIRNALLEKLQQYFAFKGLDFLFTYLLSGKLNFPNNNLGHQDWLTIRANLGDRIYQLPDKNPWVKGDYRNFFDRHSEIKFNLFCLAAEAESIAGIETRKTFWSGGRVPTEIRRNMLYNQYLLGSDYPRLLAYLLSKQT